MSGPIDEMQKQKHLAEAEAEIARLKAEITELTKHVQLGAEHKKGKRHAEHRAIID